MDFHSLRLVGSALLKDRDWLVASTVCFLLSFAYTAGTLGDRRLYSKWWNLGVVALGFALQTVFLALRGHAVGRCPLTNLFEVIAFLCWALVLFYLDRRQHLPALAAGHVHRARWCARCNCSPLRRVRPPGGTVRRASASTRGWNSTRRSRSCPSARSPWRGWPGGCTSGRNASSRPTACAPLLPTAAHRRPGPPQRPAAGGRLRAAEPGPRRGCRHGHAEHLAAPRLGRGRVGDLRFSGPGALGRVAARAPPGGEPVGGGVHGRVADARRPVVRANLSPTA